MQKILKTWLKELEQFEQIKSKVFHKLRCDACDEDIILDIDCESDYFKYGYPEPDNMGNMLFRCPQCGHIFKMRIDDLPGCECNYKGELKK